MSKANQYVPRKRKNGTKHQLPLSVNPDVMALYNPNSINRIASFGPKTTNTRSPFLTSVQTEQFLRRQAKDFTPLESSQARYDTGYGDNCGLDPNFLFRQALPTPTQQVTPIGGTVSCSFTHSSSLVPELLRPQDVRLPAAFANSSLTLEDAIRQSMMGLINPVRLRAPDAHGDTQGSSPRPLGWPPTPLPICARPLQLDYGCGVQRGGAPRDLENFDEASILGTGSLSEDDASSIDFNGEDPTSSWWGDNIDTHAPATPSDQHSREGMKISPTDDAESIMIPLPITTQRSSSPALLVEDDVVCKEQPETCDFPTNISIPDNGDETKEQFLVSHSSTFVASLALPADKTSLTPYQILLRQSLQYFKATQDDVDARVRGRKQKIQMGQIGVQCRYCAHLQVTERGKGAVYFPRTLKNVYQAAQNIAAAHYCCDDYICPFLPIHLVEELDVQKPKRDASKGGRAYWLQACVNMGIYEDNQALWLAARSHEGTAPLPS